MSKEDICQIHFHVPMIYFSAVTTISIIVTALKLFFFNLKKYVSFKEKSTKKYVIFVNITRKLVRNT